MHNYFAHSNTPGRYSKTFSVLKMSLSGKGHLESGGKILLPPSALDALSRLNIQYPMLFEISNPAKHRSAHCGVQEFVAEEGICYMPAWMMENLHLKDNDNVEIKSTALPNGSFVKIQPHSSSFLEISNPKAVLENALRKFSTLTKAEDFVIEYNKNKYYLRVVDIKPTNPSNAISIIETDISVDFAPPLDQKESPTTQAKNTAGGGGLTFGGGSSGLTFGNPTSKPIGIDNTKKPNNKKDDDSDSDSDSDDDKPKFKAFTGMGARLDGKVGTPPKTSFGSPKTSTTPPNSSLLNNNNNNNSNNSSSSTGGKSGGFVAFQGQGRSLKD